MVCMPAVALEYQTNNRVDTSWVILFFSYFLIVNTILAILHVTHVSTLGNVRWVEVCGIVDKQCRR